MEIKEYITTIIYISIFAIILELFLPQSKLKKYISSIISLLIIITIVTPIVNIFTEENIEKSIDNAIYALSNNTNITSSTSLDFSEYQNKIIVSRVKENIEQEMKKEFSEALKDIVTLIEVNVELDDEYKINQVKVYVEGGNLNTAKIIIDRIITEYNVPSSMLKIVERGV